MAEGLSEEDLKNQLSLISESVEIIRFLDFLGKKAIINQSTVHCRMTACNHFFDILEEHENNVEYMLQHLDILMNRYRNKNPNVSKDTVRVYKSRIKGSLEDYRAWCRDPIAWERTISIKGQQVDRKNRPTKKNYKELAANITPPVARTAEAQAPQTAGRKVSFPIRPDFEVEMVIPGEGITRKELQKIALFLYPYCKDIDIDEAVVKLPH